MIFFFHFFLLTLSKKNPTKFAYLFIDQSYSQSKEKENDEHYTKLCKDMFKKACNSFSGDEKDQCDLLCNSFLGVFVSDLDNSKQKIHEMQKNAKIIYINGRPSKIANNKHKSKMSARLDADESLSPVQRIQKTVNKTVSDMIKRKFNERKLSFRELHEANRLIKKTVKQNKNENLFEPKKHKGLHIKGDGSKASLIIGIVFICVFFVIAIIVLVCYCVKKKKAVQNQDPDKQSNENQNPGQQQQQNYPNQQYQQQPQYPPQQNYPNQQYPQQPQYPPQQNYPNQQYPQQPQYPPQQNYPNQQYQQQPLYPPQQNNPNQQYQQQPLYPPQQNNPNQPYANPSGYPEQQNIYNQDQNYSYPNQAYQSQPYANQAIPDQPYENANYNQFQGRDISECDSDSNKTSDASD